MQEAKIIKKLKKRTFTATAAAPQGAANDHADGVTDLLLVAPVFGRNDWLSCGWDWQFTVLWVKKKGQKRITFTVQNEGS